MQNEISFSEMLKQLNKGRVDNMRPLHITILRNIVLEPIEVPIKYFAKHSHYDAEIIFGELDNIFQDSLDEKKIPKKTDAVLLAAPLQALSPNIINSFCSLSVTQQEQELTYIKQFFTSTIRNIRELNKDCTIFLLDFELPCSPSFGINDLNMPNGQTLFIKKLNQNLLEVVNQYSCCVLLNSDHLLRQVGANSFYDWRYWYVNRCLYSKAALVGIAKLMQGYIDALHGGTKKCLVLDCDNTLWGGVIGEDGLSGIQLSNNYPGACYQDFQKAIVDLHKQGVIIALCSKNNEADVKEVFTRHQDMVLQEQHIATHQINWNDKASNLKQIAKDLNIGLDSLVFIDDSEFEVTLINEQLPQVKTILLDKLRPSEHHIMLRKTGFFDKISITNEDTHRGELYKEQTLRVDYERKINNIDEYLRTLNMKLTLSLVKQHSIDRVAQLTQKTNQFNLTTKRYSEDNIREFINSKQSDVVVLDVSDRFGDIGEVGTLIVHYIDDIAYIDTFLLSCRALGRTIEHEFLTKAIEVFKSKGISVVKASYLPTSKNGQVSGFYTELGFTMVTESNDETKYELVLSSSVNNNTAQYFVVDNFWLATN